MTFCVAINADIVVATCPLKKGACYWQHRKTNLCRYTNDELSIEEFCSRVGAQVPTEEHKCKLVNDIRTAVSSNL